MVFHASGMQVFFDIRFGHANVEVPLKGNDSRTIDGFSAALDNSGIHEPNRCNSYRENAERNDFPHRKHSTVGIQSALLCNIALHQEYGL